MTIQPPVCLLVVTLLVGGVMSACAAKAAGDADTVADDGGAPPGTLDRTKLRAPCTNSRGCDAGGCYEFGSVEPPIEGGRCVDVTNGCAVLACASGYTCRATGGDPSGIDCVKQMQ